MAVFYIPLDHAAFVAANPAFADLPAPTGPGLQFDPCCLSCGSATDNTATIISGSGHGRHREQFDQPVFLCPDCLLAGEATRRKRLGVRAAIAVVSVTGATVLSATARFGFDISHIASIAAWLVLVILLYAVGIQYLFPQPVQPWEPVEIFWFRDPRKGENATFLCVRIDNTEQSTRFRTLNPQSITADRWDASYNRPTATGKD